MSIVNIKMPSFNLKLLLILFYLILPVIMLQLGNRSVFAQSTSPITSPAASTRVGGGQTVTTNRKCTAIGTPTSPNPCAGLVRNLQFYCQWDPRWASTCTLGHAGCGPTSLAMIFTAFGDTITPPDMDAQFRQYRACGDFESYMPSALAEQTFFTSRGYVVSAQLVGDNGKLNLPMAKSYLDAGNLILASSSSFPPCSSPGHPCGHIFVVDQVTVENAQQNIGTVEIRDPNNCNQGDPSTERTDRRVYGVNEPPSDFAWYYAYALKKTGVSINGTPAGGF